MLIRQLFPHSAWLWTDTNPQGLWQSSTAHSRQHLWYNTTHWPTESMTLTRELFLCDHVPGICASCSHVLHQILWCGKLFIINEFSYLPTWLSSAHWALSSQSIIITETMNRIPALCSFWLIASRTKWHSKKEKKSTPGDEFCHLGRETH